MAEVDPDSGAEQEGEDAGLTRDAGPERDLCGRAFFKSSPLVTPAEPTEDPCVFRLLTEISEDDFPYISVELDGVVVMPSEVDGFSLEEDHIRLHGMACLIVSDSEVDHALSINRELCPVEYL